MIRLFTVCAWRSDLIELQLQSFNKYLKDEFEYVVFNDGASISLNDDISNECNRLGLRCIQVERDQDLINRLQPYEPMPIINQFGDYSTQGTGNEYSLCWAWENYICREPDMVCLMHSDIFLIGDFKPSYYAKKYDLCYIPQKREGIEEYMWEAFVLLNMKTLPYPQTMCWLGGGVGGYLGDTSVQTCRYLRAYPQLTKYYIDSIVYENDPSVSAGTREVYEIMYFDMKPTVLHYTSASNWDNQSAEYHQTKTAWLKKALNDEIPIGLVRGKK